MIAVLGGRLDSTVLLSRCSGECFGRCWAPLIKESARVTTPRRAGAAVDPETLLTLHAIKIIRLQPTSVAAIFHGVENGQEEEASLARGNLG